MELMKSTRKSQADLDVDVRFLLANERTLLAWIRTSLALLAGGFALAHISGDVSTVGRAAGIVAVIFGGTLSLIGYSRFRAADRAIRGGYLPRRGIGPAIEVGLVVLVAIVLAILQLVDSGL
jgi:putative membrane protein